jgi:hypothetical protein
MLQLHRRLQRPAEQLPLVLGDKQRLAVLRVAGHVPGKVDVVGHRRAVAKGAAAIHVLLARGTPSDRTALGAC